MSVYEILDPNNKAPWKALEIYTLDTASNVTIGGSLDVAGATTLSGNIVVSNPGPVISILNNANPPNSNRASLFLSGSINNNGRAAIQQNNDGDMIVEDLDTNGELTMKINSAASINLDAGAGKVKLKGTNYDTLNRNLLGIELDNTISKMAQFIPLTTIDDSLSLLYGGVPATGATYSTNKISFSRMGNILFFSLELNILSKGSGPADDAPITILGLPVISADNCVQPDNTVGVYNVKYSLYPQPAGTLPYYNITLCDAENASTTLNVRQYGDSIGAAPQEFKNVLVNAIFTVSGFYYV